MEKGITRRETIKGLAAIFGGLLAFDLSPLPPGPEPKLAGETLIYSFSVLKFADVGTATFSLDKEGNDLYLGTFKTDPRGLLPKLASVPRFTYQARMERLNGGRLRALEIIRRREGSEVREERESYDYNLGIFTYQVSIDGEKKETGQREIPRGTMIDSFLSIFYNLRLQVYGEVKEGASFETQSLDKKRGLINIHIKVDGDGNRLLAQVTGDGKKGQIDLLLNRELVPVAISAVNFIGPFDLFGKLKERKTA